MGNGKNSNKYFTSLKTDSEALEVAFTQYISARAPEDRGNGLKFVKDIVVANAFDLLFYTGNATLHLGRKTPEIKIEISDKNFHSCIAIIHY